MLKNHLPQVTVWIKEFTPFTWSPGPVTHPQARLRPAHPDTRHGVDSPFSPTTKQALRLCGFSATPANLVFEGKWQELHKEYSTCKQENDSIQMQLTGLEDKAGQGSGHH